MTKCRTCGEERKRDQYFTLADGTITDECAICRLDRHTKERGRALAEQINDKDRKAFLETARLRGVDKLLEWGNTAAAELEVDIAGHNYPDIDNREVVRSILIELFDLEDQP